MATGELVNRPAGSVVTGPTYVIGVDPGPTPGVAALSFTHGKVTNAQALQCSANMAVGLVVHLLVGAQPARIVLAVERFVVGPRAARSSTARAGVITRQLIGALQAAAEAYGVLVRLRSAADVKPWATDARLRAAGLLEVCTGMPHARDAARHALFTAVHDAGLPDPLIRHRSPR